MLKSFVDAHQCALTCLATMHDQVASCEEHIAALKVELSAACRRQMVEACTGVPRAFQGQVLEDNALTTLLIVIGCGFTSRGQELRSGFSAAVCKIQAIECCVESLPLMIKDKRSCFSQSERFAVQLPLDCTLALWT